MNASLECPGCRQSPSRPYFSNAQGDLNECLGCGLIYLYPLPGPDEMTRLYTDGYSGTVNVYLKKPEKKLRRARQRARIIAGFARRPPGRFLDIGCNAGFMAEAARERGFKAWGIDPDPVSIDYARRHYPDNEFTATRLEDFAPLDADGHPVRFDIIYCSEVIEHTPTPREFLTKIFQLLAPGGMLYLTTPDISHWRRPRDLARWDAFNPPSHCLYFTPGSLIGLAQSCGFRLHSKRLALKPGIKLVLLRPLKS